MNLLNYKTKEEYVEALNKMSNSDLKRELDNNNNLYESIEYFYNMLISKVYVNFIDLAKQYLNYDSNIKEDYQKFLYNFHVFAENKQKELELLSHYENFMVDDIIEETKSLSREEYIKYNSAFYNDIYDGNEESNDNFSRNYYSNIEFLLNSVIYQTAIFLHKLYAVDLIDIEYLTKYDNSPFSLFGGKTKDGNIDYKMNVRIFIRNMIGLIDTVNLKIYQ